MCDCKVMAIFLPTLTSHRTYVFEWALCSELHRMCHCGVGRVAVERWGSEFVFRRVERVLMCCGVCWAVVQGVREMGFVCTGGGLCIDIEISRQINMKSVRNCVGKTGIVYVCM